MMVNVIGYALFMTPQYEVILMFGEVCTLLSRYCSLQCVTVIHIN